MINVRHAIKQFGQTKALDDLSFTIAEGKICGLVGTNGSGKSTILKAIAGLIRLDHGEITIDGKAPCLETRGVITYLPDGDVWYPWMTVSDAMRYMKDFYWDWDERKAKRLLDDFNLREDWVIQFASKGTQTKMKLLLALSRQAKYLLLDEPFSGIDPFARQEIAQAIMEDFLEEGQTIIISTHEVADVEMLLDDIYFLHKGKLLLDGNVESLKQIHNKSMVDLLREVYQHACV
ncbi:MAG: ABC transporter ATP-binding protein [Clostridia bacterium]